MDGPPGAGKQRSPFGIESMRRIPVDDRVARLLVRPRIGARQGQVGPSIPVPIPDGGLLPGPRPQVPALGHGKPAFGPVIDEAVGLAGRAARSIDHHHVVDAVPVQVRHQPFHGPICRQVDPPERVDGLTVVQVDPGVLVFTVSVAVGHEKIDVTVPVQIQPVDQLEPAPARDVDVGAGVLERPLGKGSKTLVPPHLGPKIAAGACPGENHRRHHRQQVPRTKPRLHDHPQETNSPHESEPWLASGVPPFGATLATSGNRSGGC